MFGFKMRNFIQIYKYNGKSIIRVGCGNYMSKKETDFCRSYKRDKAFCTISGFKVTLN